MDVVDLHLTSGVDLEFGAEVAVVPHPWRWVLAHMARVGRGDAAIFLGVTSAGARWSFLSVVAWGTLTGVVGRVALGVVTGRFLASVSAPARAAPKPPPPPVIATPGRGRSA